MSPTYLYLSNKKKKNKKYENPNYFWINQTQCHSIQPLATKSFAPSKSLASLTPRRSLVPFWTPPAWPKICSVSETPRHDPTHILLSDTYRNNRRNISQNVIVWYCFFFCSWFTKNLIWFFLYDWIYNCLCVSYPMCAKHSTVYRNTRWLRIIKNHFPPMFYLVFHHQF